MSDKPNNNEHNTGRRLVILRAERDRQLKRRPQTPYIKSRTAKLVERISILEGTSI